MMTGGWNSFYNDKKVSPKPGTAKQQKKFSVLEDAYNERWQAIVNGALGGSR